MHARRRVREAVPHAGLLPDLGPVPGARHRPRLAHLSRPQGRALRLFLRAVGHHPVRLQGAGHGRRAGRARRRPSSISLAFVEPFGTLWFIYLLPIFFVVTKLTRAVPPLVDLARRRGAGDRARSTTGWMVIDEFAEPLRLFLRRLHACAASVFALRRRRAGAGRRSALAGLVAVGASSTASWSARGLCRAARSSRSALGLAGAGGRGRGVARCWPSVDAVRRRCAICGEHSIVDLSRLLPAHGGDARGAAQDRPHPDLGTISLSSQRPAWSARSLLFWAVRSTPLRFLFERPARFWLTPKRRAALQPAE